MARDLARVISEAPKRIKARLAANLPEAAREFDKAAGQVLGVPGTPTARSRPGEPPRRQTGATLAATRAIPEPATLSVRIVSSKVGGYQDAGTSRMAPRPWIKRVIELGMPGFRRAMARPR